MANGCKCEKNRDMNGVCCFACCLRGSLLEYFDVEELCEATTDCEDRLSKELVHLFLLC